MGVKKKVIQRIADCSTDDELKDLHPVLRRIYLNRNITSKAELDRSLNKLPSPWLLAGMKEMVRILAEALRSRQRLLILADFDADGATSCACAVLGLRLLGAEQVSYVVPNRFEYGYGLTPEIVEVASQKNPHIIVTVDNGISSLDGVAAARERGIRVLVTDHHLPPSRLPEADAIVNPNLPGDPFPSEALAGVGVMFYVLMALRAHLREKGWFDQQGLTQPNLAQLLDLVALGTVADVVPLDHVNRILVHQGLQRIRAGQARPGVQALIEVANRSAKALTSSDLGFALGPRLNAAGRLEDMSLGIECLLAETSAQARSLAARLNALNLERRAIEEQMKVEAFALLKEKKALDKARLQHGICLFDEGWHQGVIGILAARLKERLHRPVIAFAPAGTDEIKGSARSIAGIHIRDVLSEVAARCPGLLTKFGGHAMAAGMSLRLADLPEFSRAFDETVRMHLKDVDLEPVLYTDGALNADHLALDFAEILRFEGPWGQGFPEPVFDGEFEIVQLHIVAEKHLKFVLKIPAVKRMVEAIAFFVDEPESWLGCRLAKFAYRLDIDEFRSQRRVRLVIEHMEAYSGKLSPP